MLMCSMFAACTNYEQTTNDNMEQTVNNPIPGTDGNKYVPYEQRTGNESVVYFTRSLSAEGLIKAYEQVCENISGRVGVKLHTGEQNGPNIIPRELLTSSRQIPIMRVIAIRPNSIVRRWK